MKARRTKKIISMILTTLMLVSNVQEFMLAQAAFVSAPAEEPIDLVSDVIETPNASSLPDTPEKADNESYPEPVSTDEEVPVETPAVFVEEEEAAPSASDGPENAEEALVVEPDEALAVELEEAPMRYTQDDFFQVVLKWVPHADDHGGEGEYASPAQAPVAAALALEYQAEDGQWYPVDAAWEAMEGFACENLYAAKATLSPGDTLSLNISLIHLPTGIEYRARLSEGVPAGQDFFIEYTDATRSTVVAFQRPLPIAAMSGAVPFDLDTVTLIFDISLTVNGALYREQQMSFDFDGSGTGQTIESGEAYGFGYTVTLAPGASDTVDYTIALNVPSNYIAIGPQTLTGNVPGDQAEPIPASFQATEEFDYVFEKHWHDEFAQDRPGASFVLQVKKASAGDDTWADGQSFSLTAQPNVGHQTKTFTLPRYDADGDALEYRVIETPVPSQYIATLGGSAATTYSLINTRKTSISITKEWLDISTKDDTRPASDPEWLAGLTLWRVKTDGTIEQVPVTTPPTVAETTVDKWDLSFTDLPAYDENGAPYTYYVQEDTSAWESNPAYGDYVTSLQNLDGSGGDGCLYDGGISTSVITQLKEFQFTKQWQDGTGENRPTITFRLYRMLKDPASAVTVPDILTASPVPNMDAMKIVPGDGTDFGVPITYKGDGGTELPRYDQDGQEYLYFAVESLSGNTTDYVQYVLSNQPGAMPIKGDLLEENGTIINKKEANFSASVTKTWVAKALQSMNASVTFALQKLGASDWETVATLEITGFTSESMSKSGLFGSQPKYDAAGYPIEYRVVEAGAAINGQPVAGTFGENNNTFTFDNPADGVTYEFQVSQDPATGEIKNTLIGNTAIGVHKIWIPATSDPTAITIQILQNGVPFLPEDLPSPPELGITQDETDKTITITAPAGGNFQAIFDGLPKFDPDGRVYEYTIDEVDWPAGYQYTNIAYKKVAGILIAELTNTVGSGQSSLLFVANKVWLDGSDIEHRNSVLMGLYLKGDDTPVATFTLEAANMWMKRVYYTPIGAQSTHTGDYLIREIKVGGNDVDYPGFSLAAGIGQVGTTEHIYEVTHQDSDGRCTVTNRRIGVVDIIVEKTWIVGNDAAGLQAEFTALGIDSYGAEYYTATEVLDESTNAPLFPNLDKYDARGEIIHYSVRETGIEKAGVVTPFAGGVADVPGVGTIHSELTGEAYVVGSQHTDDTLTHQYQNIRKQSGKLVVNKVWRDEGSAIAPRTDISLSLVRKSTNISAPEPEIGIAGERDWDTELNDWFWQCAFGTLPIYDAGGFRYEYFVTEHIGTHDSKYAATYFSDTPNDGINEMPDAAGTTSEETFSPMGNGSHAMAGFAGIDVPGTIINTIADTIAISGSKIWTGCPEWFKDEYLPTVYVQLYRMPEGEWDSSLPDAVKFADKYRAMDGNGDIIYDTLVNGESTFTFPVMDYYSEYGIPYVYYIREMQKDSNGDLEPLDINGYSSTHDGMTVTNAYNDPGKAEITVKKAWDWSGKDASQHAYPRVTFDLHQQWSNGALTRNVVVASHSFAAGSIAGYTGPLSYTFTKGNDGHALPHYAPDGTPYTYQVVERSLGYAYTATVTPTDGIASLTATTDAVTGETIYKGEVEFSNTYQPHDRTSIEATKIWDDEQNAYGTRPSISAPTGLVYTLHRKTASLAPEAVTGASASWAQSATANEWTCTFTPNASTLPAYATTGEQYTYYVEEDLRDYAKAYTLTAGAGTLTLTNSLITISLEGSKHWHDGHNPARPDFSGITLLVCSGPSKTPLSHQPVIQWRTSQAADNEWGFQFTGLPKYQADGFTPVQYSIVENPVPAGYVVTYRYNGDLDADGNISGVSLYNIMGIKLQITNITANQGAVGIVPPGGFVSSGTTGGNHRNFDAIGADENNLFVYWKPEANWDVDDTVTVSYVNDDATTGSVTFSLANDVNWINGVGFVASLRTRFPSAVLTKGSYRLTFTTDPAEMPNMPDSIAVQVSFTPTIAVVNTTNRQVGGEVSVKGGHWNTQNDGISSRYEALVVYGKAAPKYWVDMNNLTLQVPGGSSAKLTPDANGNFSVSLPAMLGGVMDKITVAGKVDITARDAGGRAAAVTVSLTALPASLNVGIPFITFPASTTPQTSDDRNFELYYGILGIGLALFISGMLLTHCDRKRQRG